MKVHVQLFGALRRLAPGAFELELPNSESSTKTSAGTATGTCTVAELRQRLSIHLREPAPSARELELLTCSAVASDDAILAETSLIANGALVAILPPVSGG